MLIAFSFKAVFFTFSFYDIIKPDMNYLIYKILNFRIIISFTQFEGEVILQEENEWLNGIWNINQEHLILFSIKIIDMQGAKTFC